MAVPAITVVDLARFPGFHETPLSPRTLHEELGHKGTYQSSSSHFQLIIVCKIHLTILQDTWITVINSILATASMLYS